MFGSAVSAGHQGCRRGAGGEENSDSDRKLPFVCRDSDPVI